MHAVSIVNSITNNPILPTQTNGFILHPASLFSFASFYHFRLLQIAKMAAMFSQNPLMNGPNYSFNDAPKSNNDGFRQHRFDP